MKPRRSSLLPSLSLVVIALVAGTAAAREAASLHRPVFFPSGEELVVMSTRDGGDWELYRVSTDGSDFERLTVHPGWDGYADVSPDGRRIVFDRRDEQEAGIVLADSDGSHSRWLVRSEADGFLGGGRFAPDGASILYVSEESGNREIFRLWLADERRERLTHTEQDETDAVFSPDGARVAYAVWTDDGTSALEVVSLEGGSVDRVVTTTGSLYGVAWSPSGDALFYNDDSDGDQDVYRVDLEMRRPENLTANDAPDHLPAVSPDGRRIVFTSERAGAEAVFELELESGRTRRLDLLPSAAAQPPP